MLAAGSFTAFLATSCGVLTAVSGAVSACVARAGVRSFRLTIGAVTLGTLGLTALTTPGGSVLLVLVGFSLAAATFCPLLLLGIWWRRLTDAGVAAGFLLGGGLTLGLVVAERVGVNVGIALHYPAPVAVPLAFAAMMVISLLTPTRVPAATASMMARMHLPEHLAGPSIDRSSPGDDRPS